MVNKNNENIKDYIINVLNTIDDLPFDELLKFLMNEIIIHEPKFSAITISQHENFPLFLNKILTLKYPKKVSKGREFFVLLALCEFKSEVLYENEMFLNYLTDKLKQENLLFIESAAKCCSHLTELKNLEQISLWMTSLLNNIMIILVTSKQNTNQLQLSKHLKALYYFLSSENRIFRQVFQNTTGIAITLSLIFQKFTEQLFEEYVLDIHIYLAQCFLVGYELNNNNNNNNNGLKLTQMKGFFNDDQQIDDDNNNSNNNNTHDPKETLLKICVNCFKLMQMCAASQEKSLIEIEDMNEKKNLKKLNVKRIDLFMNLITCFLSIENGKYTDYLTKQNKDLKDIYDISMTEEEKERRLLKSMTKNQRKKYLANKKKTNEEEEEVVMKGGKEEE